MDAELIGDFACGDDQVRCAQQGVVAVSNDSRAGVGLLAVDDQVVLVCSPRGLHEPDLLAGILHEAPLLHVDLAVRGSLWAFARAEVAAGAQRIFD